jgi:glycogen debranching enzyme
MSNEAAATRPETPAVVDLTEAGAETRFYIPSVGSPTRPRRTLKHDDTFAVFDSHGDIGATAAGSDGIFHEDTRYLSRLELLLNGMQPLLLDSTVRDDNMMLMVDLTNPDMYFERRLVLPRDTLHIVRSLYLWRGAAWQRLALQNHGDRTIRLQLSFTFSSDFADLFEVRGTRRQRHGTAKATVNGPDTVTLSYHGLDHENRRTVLHFEPVPSGIAESSASYQLALAPGERRALFVTATCAGGNEKIARPSSFRSGLLAAHHDLRRATRDVASAETSNELVNEVLRRSRADLSMLMTATPQGPYPYAGTPWYSTTFGRDGLITALQMLWFDPSVARGVLRRLAHFQAKAIDPIADAEPGKILHEMRSGEMAALHEVPFGLYYGSIDSTPLFILLAGRYAERSGDWALAEELWPAIEAALGWIDKFGDRDGDGFVEYFRASEEGLANQGWKDSFDAVFHADGRLAQGPIALCEVQAYVFAAKMQAAAIARRLGHMERAAALVGEAQELAARFEAAFWCPEIDSYALALDGAKKQCRVRTSNAGQVLFTGIADAANARAVGRGLMRPDFFGGWGIRTVSALEQRYNPMSYHNGSVWPHDNAIIALGLARYGLKQELERVFNGLMDAATYMEMRRLPELFCGFQRRRGRGPTLYPVACTPQAWAAATPFSLLQALLGLEFDPQKRELRLRDPVLPATLDWVIIRNLKLGAADLDFIARRHASGGVSVEVLRRQGMVRLSVVFS